MHDDLPYDPVQKLHFSRSISSAIYNGSW